MTRVVIQKFGGTSLTNRDLREGALSSIRRRREQGYKPVVVVSAIGRDADPYSTDGLLAFATKSVGPPSARNKDLIMSCGETISAAIFAQFLEDEGLPSIALTGQQAGIVTVGPFTNGTIKGIEVGRIQALIDKDIVPVVAGFQGGTIDGDIATIGRGGSDTTACALGSVLAASAIEIYTDVEGVMTADPRTVPKAQVLPRIDYSELQALSVKGARVIHSPAIALAAERQVPIIIRETGSSRPGTTASPVEPRRPVTGVARISDITHFQISLETDSEPSATISTLREIAEKTISIHFIDFRPEEMAFVVDNGAAPEVEAILDARSLRYRTALGFAKVSVVGVGMTGKPGMLSRVIATLNAIGVDVYQATDSATSISCLIRHDDSATAVQALHDAFNIEV